MQLDLCVSNKWIRNSSDGENIPFCKLQRQKLRKSGNWISLSISFSRIHTIVVVAAQFSSILICFCSKTNQFCVERMNKEYCFLLSALFIFLFHFAVVFLIPNPRNVFAISSFNLPILRKNAKKERSVKKP